MSPPAYKSSTLVHISPSTITYPRSSVFAPHDIKMSVLGVTPVVQILLVISSSKYYVHSMFTAMRWIILRIGKDESMKIGEILLRIPVDVPLLPCVCTEIFRAAHNFDNAISIMLIVKFLMSKFIYLLVKVSPPEVHTESYFRFISRYWYLMFLPKYNEEYIAL